MFSPFVGLMIIFFTALCKYFKISKTKILITLCHFYIDIVCMVQHRVTQDWPRKGKNIKNKGHLWYSKWWFQGHSRKLFCVNLICLNFPGGGVSWPPNPPSDPRMGSMQYNAFCTLRLIYHSLSITFVRVSQLHAVSLLLVLYVFHVYSFFPSLNSLFCVIRYQHTIMLKLTDYVALFF